MSLDFYDWLNLIPLIVHPEVTESIFIFMIKFNLFDFLLKTNTKYEFLTATRFYFSTLSKSDAYQRSWNLQGLSNLLKFLRVEPSVIESLIEKTSKQKNCNEIYKFLMHQSP